MRMTVYTHYTYTHIPGGVMKCPTFLIRFFFIVLYSFLFCCFFFISVHQQQAPSDISKIGSNGIERLKKRVGSYRQHHHECRPRFDQTFSGACEQQSHETVILQNRFLANKAKKAAKKADKKQPENSSLAGNLQGSIHVVSIFRNIYHLYPSIALIKGSHAHVCHSSLFLCCVALPNQPRGNSHIEMY